MGDSLTEQRSGACGGELPTSGLGLKVGLSLARLSLGSGWGLIFLGPF